MLTLWLACTGDDKAATDTTDDYSDTDTDTDSDTDSDTDTDTDADTDSDTDSDTDTDAHSGGGHTAIPLPLDGAVFDGTSGLLDTDGSCYDALFWAVDSGANAMLRANVAGASTLAASGVYQVVVDLAVGSPEVSVEAWTGNRLTGNLCVGAYNPYGNPVVNTTWTPISGTLDLTLTPSGGYGGTGDLVFTDVHFEDGTGRVGRIDHLEIHGNWPLFPP